ncbi:hypothetical protein [Myxacorys almedinensis]|uniref:Uncharacterized protein n=1 Tax=Myxacorys almedinensis A TaxID=2690445 RepID=A0A8J7Z569_9CYAN|nr:hypothetical protein [Myxacorys almedinensis]NDJ18308.1 hypothetical protein [Myxacorys almedinensis A]
MLTQHRKPVRLYIVSRDLPIWSEVETTGTIYQKSTDQFHLVLTEPRVNESASRRKGGSTVTTTPRLIWLDISPCRIAMTMQGDGKVSYRHLWQRGVYGFSRYWLQDDSTKPNPSLQLRNFTRTLWLEQSPFPKLLQLDYELWSEKLQLGSYVLHLEISD